MTEPDAGDFLDRVAAAWRRRYEQTRRVMAFDEFLAQDAIEHFGHDSTTIGEHTRTRWHLFDAPFDGGTERVVGNEGPQDDVVRLLRNFVRERRVNRLILLHGPNGSAKSSFVAALMRGLEAYSHTDEGAMYRFSWVFPARNGDGGARIGFGAEREGSTDESFAHLDDELIATRLPSEANDNPLFLLPPSERAELLKDVEDGGGFVLSDAIRRGELGRRSRAVFDALLVQYRGDVRQVWRHVQVERFYVSRTYQSAAVTVEPQLRVDAGVRQLTADRSLSALPTVLQSQTLFETFGPLVEGNRGVIEYNDLFKRPMDANKYLLSTSERGTVTLDIGRMQLDAVLVATANETYLEAFKQQPDWSSYKGRFELVRMPYLLDYTAEQGIYDDLLATLELPRPVAPHTTFAVALWAVLTRLHQPNPDRYPQSIREVIAAMSPLQKARLYADGTVPDGLTAEQQRILLRCLPHLLDEGQDAQHYEGRHGASAREMKAILLNAAHGDGDTLSPPRVFAELQRLVQDVSVYEWLRIEPEGQFHRPAKFIDVVRDAWLDRVEAELRDATGLIDETEYRRVFERYVTHVNHWLRGEKLTDPVTGRDMPADESMMDSIENVLGREDEARAFRSDVISRIAAFRIDNRDAPVELARIFPRYIERLRSDYYARKRVALQRLQRDLLTWMDDPSAMEPAAAVAAEQTMDALCARHGYTPETAREAVGVLVAQRYGDPAGAGRH